MNAGVLAGQQYPELCACPLWQVMSISQMIRSEFGPDRSLSGIGGVETGRDAAEFLLLGAQTVQVQSRDGPHGMDQGLNHPFLRSL